MHHSMEVDQPYHQLIKLGIKPVEGRKMSEKWLKINIGDVITMTSNVDPAFDVIVENIRYYPPNIYVDPLTAYLQNETLQRTLPGIQSIQEGREIYLQWSSIKEICKLGMMGIQVKVI